jgi:hypothetical protein
MAQKVGDLYAELKLKKDNFEKNLTTSEKRIQKFKANAKVAFQAIGIAVAAFTAEMVRATRAAMEQEKQTMALRSILKELGLATKEETNALIKYSEALQLTTAYSDDEIQAGMAMLGTFQLNAKQIKEIMPRLLDMASYVSMNEGRHIELTDAAKRFGMALNDNVGLLKRWGVILNEEAIAADKYNGLLVSIDENYKNQAETYVNTTEGAMKRMRNMYGELEESLGMGLLPYLREFIKLMTTEMQGAEGLSAQLKDIGTWIGKTGIIIMRTVNISRQAMSELGAHITNIISGTIEMARKIPGLGNKFEGLRSSVHFLNIGFREQTDALRENDEKYKTMLENVGKFKEGIDNINMSRPPDAPQGALLPPLIGEPEAYIIPIKTSLETIDMLTGSTNMYAEAMEVATENAGELFGTMIQSGMSAEAVMKRLIGQFIRMTFLKSFGPLGGIVGGFMRAFGMQHGGVVSGMPMMNMRPDLAVANENPNVPEAVMPLDAEKLAGLFQVNVHSADPGTTVDIVLKGLKGVKGQALADSLTRDIIAPALSRDSRR